MPEIHKNCIVPYTCNQMFELIADVSRYHEFVPGIVGVTIANVNGDVFDAELFIADKMINTSYISRVVVDRNQFTVNAQSASGPFKHLQNNWKVLADLDLNHCKIQFDLTFDIRSVFLRPVIEPIIRALADMMVDAFTQRAKQLYGQ